MDLALRRAGAVIAVSLLLGACADPAVERGAGRTSQRDAAVADGAGARGEDGARARREGDEARPEAAPEFSVTTFTGDVWRVAEQRGTPVVLNFFESW